MPFLRFMQQQKYIASHTIWTIHLVIQPATYM